MYWITRVCHSFRRLAIVVGEKKSPCERRLLAVIGGYWRLFGEEKSPCGKQSWKVMEGQHATGEFVMLSRFGSSFDFRFGFGTGCGAGVAQRLEPSPELSNL